MRYLFLLCFSLVLCCCSNHENERKELDRVESLIKEDPAYAQIVLDSLYKVEESLFAEPDFQARYALLYTKAQYKSYHDPENDSLINMAKMQQKVIETMKLEKDLYAPEDFMLPRRAQMKTSVAN